MKSRTRKKGRSRPLTPPAPVAPATAAPATAPDQPEGAAHGSEAPGAARGSNGPVVPAAVFADEASFGRFFVPAALLLLLAAAALRLPDLALNPFHHDEGVNGFFTTNLMRQGHYAYNPANFHGPTLYYFALLSGIVFGLTTEAMRLVPVAFGLLTVALVLPLRRSIGPLAALTAAGLLAVSPGAVYISRYFIHEALLVCFSLAIFVAGLRYLETSRRGYLLVVAAAAALLFATKETGIIAIGVWAIAIVMTRLYVDWRTPRRRWRTADERRPRAARPARSVWIEGVEYRAAPQAGGPTGGQPGGQAGLLGRLSLDREHALAAAIVFLVIYILFYSSFFTNYPQGLIDSLATFTIWTQTSSVTQSQPIGSYVAWMLSADAPIVLLGAVGGLLAARRGRDRLSVFIGLWALGVTLAYSLIPYKTPWIVLNMLVPLALLAGLAVRELWTVVRWRRALPLLLAGAGVVSAYQAVDLNFRRYDDEAYPYVYVHTTRQMLDLLAEIDRTAERAGTGADTGVVFVTPETWPLPWYMRNHPRAVFHGRVVPTEEPMIVAHVNQRAELEPTIEGRYTEVGVYTLRPGVDLVLYVRNDLRAG